MSALTVPAEQVEVTGLALERGSHRLVFGDHGCLQATLVRREGRGAVAVTSDGTPPTTPGPWRRVLAADEPSDTLVVPVPVAAEVVLRLHVEGDVVVDLRAF